MSGGRTVVVTASGVRTSMSWWYQLRVDDSAVVVAGPPSVEGPWVKLVLAECGTVEDARVLFDLISGRLAIGAPVCDVRRLISLEDGASGIIVGMQRTT
jgi:hypothetical protein